MKKVLILIALIGVTFLAGMTKPEKTMLSEEQTAVIKAVVLEKHGEITQAAEELDADKFFEFIIDSGMGTIIQDGKVLTYQEALDSTRKGFERIVELRYEFSQKNVNVLSPDIAVLTAQGKATTKIDTGEIFNVDFAVTSIFVLKDGQWKIVHGHHSIPNPR